ncbi:DUF930 domain-containing protein [Agrobacterium larrymoorei]|nr:DUF930 domain-containing protein [Agrobacterium larrymoorei]
MDGAPKKNWRQRSWTFPASVLLHVLIVGAFYLQWPESMEAPAEPESVSVELVEPPKEEPPAEEQKAEEPPPPPAETNAEEPPPPPPPLQPSLPNIALRPDATQLDARDEPGKQEEQGGEEQPKPSESPANAKTEEPKPAEQAETPVQNEAKSEPQPETKPVDETAQASSDLAATAEDGEIAASKTPTEQETAAVAVPLPKPQVPTKPEPAADNAPSGAGNPELKPARQILSGSTLMNPMLRQMLGELPPRRRIVQMCSTEALAQIMEARAGQSQPEGIVPYTGKGGMIGGNVLNASGGAFNVGSDWYAITFRCEVDLDNYVVSDFSYQMGAKLSPSEARARGLPVQ